MSRRPERMGAKMFFAIACLASGGSASAADLIGSEFSLQAIYQANSLSPVLEGGLLTTAIVSASSVEFPNVGILDTNQPGLSLVNTSIDVGANFINIGFANAGSGRFANALQNTYVFTFDTSVGLRFNEAAFDDDLTTLPLSSSNLSFAGNQLFLYISNIPYNPSSFIRIDIPGISAVPEPASWLMLLGGFGAIGAATRRKRRVRVSYA